MTQTIYTGHVGRLSFDVVRNGKHMDFKEGEQGTYLTDDTDVIRALHYAWSFSGKHSSSLFSKGNAGRDAA